MLELVEYLNDKYSYKEDPLNFGAVFNEKINTFYSEQNNVDSFLKWLSETSKMLNADLQPMVSTFFPSLSFSIVYEVDEYKEYKIYKEEIFCISFVEEYFTSSFSSYIKEKKENGKLTFMPTKRPIRDSKFEPIYTKIIGKIEERYPLKKHLDIKRTNRVLGEFKLTYSRNPNTTIFELLFRSKLV